MQNLSKRLPNATE